MSNSNNTGTNRMEVPEAREAMDRFKMEVANEIGVPLKQGYNGHLTSAQNGSVGGEMVRQMIRKQEQSMSGTSSMGTSSMGSGTSSMGSGSSSMGSGSNQGL